MRFLSREELHRLSELLCSRNKSFLDIRTQFVSDFSPSKYSAVTVVLCALLDVVSLSDPEDQENMTFKIKCGSCADAKEDKQPSSPVVTTQFQVADTEPSHLYTIFQLPVERANAAIILSVTDEEEVVRVSELIRLEYYIKKTVVRPLAPLPLEQQSHYPFQCLKLLWCFGRKIPEKVMELSPDIFLTLSANALKIHFKEIQECTLMHENEIEKLAKIHSLSRIIDGSLHLYATSERATQTTSQEHKFSMKSLHDALNVNSKTSDDTNNQACISPLKKQIFDISSMTQLPNSSSFPIHNQLKIYSRPALYRFLLDTNLALQRINPIELLDLFGPPPFPITNSSGTSAISFASFGERTTSLQLIEHLILPFTFNPTLLSSDVDIKKSGIISDRWSCSKILSEAKSSTISTELQQIALRFMKNDPEAIYCCGISPINLCTVLENGNSTLALGLYRILSKTKYYFNFLLCLVSTSISELVCEILLVLFHENLITEPIAEAFIVRNLDVLWPQSSNSGAMTKIGLFMATSSTLLSGHQLSVKQQVLSRLYEFGGRTRALVSESNMIQEILETKYGI